MFKVLVFAEREFSDSYTKQTYEEARAFASGVSVGGSLYGAGSCCAYVLPNDKDEMEEWEDADEVARAMSALVRKS